MNQSDFEDMRDVLETEFIDTHSLADVIDAIIDICYEKAMHLEVNWQSPNEAKLWMDAAKALGALPELYV